ncbi:MAG: MarR family transcriptional regulator, partial [Thermoplasmata archaeon]
GLDKPLEPPWPNLREAYFLLRERWSRNFEQLGLSFSDYVVLDLCARGLARASDVARAIGITAAGATDVIDRLEGRRLVRRVADPKDRRAVHIRLTAAGQRLYRAARLSNRATKKGLDDAMSVAERRALTSGLIALTRALRQVTQAMRGGS